MDDGDLAPVRGWRPGTAVKDKLAFVRPFLSGDNAYERAFAGAVRSRDAKNLAGPNIEIEARKRDGCAIPLL